MGSSEGVRPVLSSAGGKGGRWAWRWVAAADAWRRSCAFMSGTQTDAPSGMPSRDRDGRAPAHVATASQTPLTARAILRRSRRTLHALRELLSSLTLDPQDQAGFDALETVRAKMRLLDASSSPQLHRAPAWPEQQSLTF